METLLLQFRHEGSPSIEEVRELFNLEAGEVDPEFGVIATDPEAGLYTVLVAVEARERVATALSHREADPAEGIFADPRIEPFGPPES